MAEQKKPVRANRSSRLPFNVASAARQSLLIGSGFSRDDLSKPMVGVIVQQAHPIHPGHTHLARLAQEVTREIRKAGGVPVEMDVGGFCDGVIMPNPQYTFAQRNLITNMIEVAAEANLMDALVLLASCDKSVPAAIMGAARTNLPAILVLGGVMAPGNFQDQKISLEDVIHSVGKVSNNEMDEALFNIMVDQACTADGACCCMTTGVTMQIIAEALGMCLPGNSSALGAGGEIRGLARQAGALIMELWEKDRRPRDIITEKSIANAIKVCLAVGGSIHAMYHLPAIAVEAGLKMDIWKLFDDFSQIIPTLTGIAPNGEYDMEDYREAGGTPAIMKALETQLNGEAVTVTGEPIKSYYENALVKNSAVICPLESPWRKESGLAVLRGNIAQGGSALRVSGILPHMKNFRGRAKVFMSEAVAIQYLRENRITEPTVFALINQGLIGAPGIRTLLPLSGEIVGSGLEEKVAVVSDGRFSGGARGFCIGLVTPESARGGELGLVQDGDFIAIDVEKRGINLEISDAEMARRKMVFTPYEPKLNSPFLSSFIKSVRSLHEGAVEGDVDRSQYQSLGE